MDRYFIRRSFTIKDIESLKKDYAEEPVCLMMQQEMEGMERKEYLPMLLETRTPLDQVVFNAWNQ